MKPGPAGDPPPVAGAESDRLERLVRRYDGLRQVVEEISSELELRPLLTSIIRHACELLDARDGSIGLYDERREVFRTEAIYRMPVAELGREMPCGVGLAGLVLERRAAVVLDRYDQAPQPMLPNLPELAANAVVGMPIFWRDRLIGFFGIGAAPPRTFDAKDVEILGLLGRHAAVAIENARLYERVQQSAVLEERNRLARELHDSVTQKMFSLALIAQTLAPAWKRDPAEGERRTERLVELSGAALAEMRSLLAELSPPSPPLADRVGPGDPDARIEGGLIAALRNLIREHAKDGLKVAFLLRGYDGEDDDLEHTLFRVAQEALANVAKHARVEEATLLLAQEGSRIEIRVVDDGVGFHPNRRRSRPADAAGGGLGITAMRERMERHGGRLRLSSRPGGGTIVQAIVHRGEAP
ncbi:MAG TPA: sensor histidine kinase [Thermoanaerobaculia bacterium]|jgi:signal transduction histidine kinase|nr:sensor histidine kinase [Thermoanaerobaculia bacterium]